MGSHICHYRVAIPKLGEGKDSHNSLNVSGSIRDVGLPLFGNIAVLLLTLSWALHWFSRLTAIRQSYKIAKSVMLMCLQDFL